MLSREQIESYHENGYLHIPGVFSADKVTNLRNKLDWMIEDWAEVEIGWSGPRRKQLMDTETEEKSKLISMHNLHFYAESWMRAVTKPAIAEAIFQLLTSDEDGPKGAPVKLHHTTMHIKPPETGHPFPMYQDWAFYKHAEDRYIDGLVHLDDTCHANGEIRFLKGSNKHGFLDHITSFVEESGEWEEYTLHLSQTEYRLQDTEAVPARAGDLVLFNIMTIHESHINTTDEMRRMVHAGYRHPTNRQLAGHSMGRPEIVMKGNRPRRQGQALFGVSGPGKLGEKVDDVLVSE